MMKDQIKFKYDVQNGTIEYEGAHGLLKPTLKALSKVLYGGDIAPVQPRDKKIKAKKKLKSSVAKNPLPSSKKPKKAAVSNKPKINADLNLLELQQFYSSKSLKTNSERVIAFIVFLSDVLKVEPVSPDDIFTCFDELKSDLKTPVVLKALENAKNLYFLIDYERGFSNITLTTKGSNLYHHEILKRAAE